MRLLVTGSSAVALFAVGAAALLFQGKPEEPEPARVAPLVKQLGNDDFQLREAAGKELHEVGLAALPALQDAAARSDDAEIRWRARQLVKLILLYSKSLGMEFSLIDPGEFKMGSPPDEKGRRGDEQRHDVKITKAFLLGKYEVTQAEYERVMKVNPSWFSMTGGGKNKIGGEDTSRFPVEKVSWFDAIDFCNTLSELDGFAPYYKLANVKRELVSIKSATVTIAGGKGYRLPTEAEWEYACRTGTTTPFHFGLENTGREANVKPVTVPGGYGGAAPKFRDFTRTTKVGTFPPNRWELSDMHGNVNEWCWDWYDKGYYGASPPADPPGPAAGNQRVQRGGSWLDLEEGCRSASRFWQTPDERKEFTGFRVARTP